MGCAKVLVILLNVLNILKGLGLLGLGITGAIASGGLALFTVGAAFTSTVTDLLGIVTGIIFYLTANFVAFLIGIGVLVLFLAIWGIVAAAKKHRVLLIIGLVFLFILLAFEVFVTSIAGLYTAQKTANLTKENFEDQTNIYQSNIEIEFRCCGIDGPTDYTLSVPLRSVPMSCDGPGGMPYSDGCGQYKGKISPTDWIWVGVLIGLSGLTFLTFICTIALCCSTGKDDYDY